MATQRPPPCGRLSLEVPPYRTSIHSRCGSCQTRATETQHTSRRSRQAKIPCTPCQETFINSQVYLALALGGLTLDSLLFLLSSLGIDLLLTDALLPQPLPLFFLLFLDEILLFILEATRLLDLDVSDQLLPNATSGRMSKQRLQ